MPALEACLAECARIGVDQYVLMGDAVGYGPDPEPVAQRVQAMASDGAVVLMGNHDQATFADSKDMNPTAAEAMRWTRENLSAQAKAFLAGLPLTHLIDAFLFVHADASAPADWRYVTDAETARASLASTPANVTFCGHVHVPQLYCLMPGEKVIAHQPVTGISIPLSGHRKWLAVVGAVGQPRDGNPAAAFTLFNTRSRELTYHRAAYDAEDVARRVLAAGLPERLAARLVKGV